MGDLPDTVPRPEPQSREVLRFPLPPDTSQPFLFRQFSVSEFIAPSKQGNVAVKEVSFSVSSSGIWSTHYFGRGSKEPITSLPLPTIGGDFRSQNMINQADHLECQNKKLLTPSNNCLVLRSKHKNSPASKKIKVDIDCKKDIKSSQNLRRIKKEKIKHEQRVKSLHWKCVLMISLLPIIPLSCIIYFARPLYENSNLIEENNLEKLAYNLKGNVLGQEEPITSLLSILSSLLNKNADEIEKMPVIVMTGSSGVGKSFLSAILASNFPPPGKTELVLLPLPPSDKIFQKFSRNGFNLIVADSLSPNSISDVRKWAQNIHNEAKWQNKPLILVLVFNVQMWHGDFKSQHEDVLHIKNLRLLGNTVCASLQTSEFDLHHIHFNLLRKDHIQECIRRDFRKQGVDKNRDIEDYVEVISGNININHDGCKTVWSQTASIATDY